MQTFSIKLRIVMDWRDARLSASPKMAPYMSLHFDRNVNGCFWTPFFTIPNTDRKELIDERYLFIRNSTGKKLRDNPSKCLTMEFP